MASSEIIAIGSELLLGETQDTNTAFLLRKLREIGVDIYRTQIIGDNVQRIANAIHESLARVDIVITTGGLGPTIDDPTREAVAKAFDENLVYHEALWNEIEVYFTNRGRQPTENNRRQAYLPASAQVIHNEIGTAPAFFVETNGKIVVSLPGVPIEMEYLTNTYVLDLLRDKYPTDDIILVRTLHCCGLGESVVDEAVAEFETWANPTLGLSAKGGITDLRITAKGRNREDASEKLTRLESEIRERIGKHIFGVDDETLPKVVSRELRVAGLKLSVTEAGTGGKIAEAFDGDVLIPESGNSADSPDVVSLRVSVSPAENGFNQVQLSCKTAQTAKETIRFFDPRLFSDQYYISLALEFLRFAILYNE